MTLLPHPGIVLAAILLVLSAFGLGRNPFPGQGTPGTRVFDRTELQDGVARILESDYKHRVGAISCAPNLPVVVGNVFYCAGMVDGTSKRIQVTVTNANGAYEVANPS